MKRGAECIEPGSPAAIRNLEKQPKLYNGELFAGLPEAFERKVSFGRPVDEILYENGYRSKDGRTVPSYPDRSDSLPFSSDMNQTISLKGPRYEGSIKGPPLSRDAVAQILRSVGANDRFAQAYKRQVEIDRMARERIYRKTQEKMSLRKKMHQNLRTKARQTLGELKIPSDHQELQMDEAEDEEETNETPTERGRQAHKRLQKAILEGESSFWSDVMA